MRVFAVFEGGGVKGIAHVGAYARLQAEMHAVGTECAGFAGASAGAIVAALAASGYDGVDEGQDLLFLEQLIADKRLDEWPGEMVRVMRSVDYTSFLDGSDEVSLADLERAREVIADIGNKMQGGKWYKPSWLTAGCTAARNYSLLGKIAARVSKLNAYGLYESRTFFEWLEKRIVDRAKDLELTDSDGLVTFGSLMQKSRRLVVVATNLTHRAPKVYSPAETLGGEVAMAVRASMSIPGFFRPYADGGSYLVDGGVVSNFPAWAFENEAKSEDVVVGFRLTADRRAAYNIDGVWPYAKELFFTVLEGSGFLETRHVRGLIEISIPVDEGISATKFDISQEEQDGLFFDGWNEAGRVLSKPAIRNKLGLPPL